MLLTRVGYRALEAAVSDTSVNTRVIPERVTLASVNGATGQPDRKIEAAFLDTVGYFYFYISTFLTQCLFCLVLLFDAIVKFKFKPVKQNDHLNYHLKTFILFCIEGQLII